MSEGKAYSYHTECPLVIASAVSDTKSAGVQIWYRRDSKEHLLTIVSKSTPYVYLGLKFDAGESLLFFIKGKGNVYLSGYTSYSKSKNENPNDQPISTQAIQINQKDDEVSGIPKKFNFLFLFSLTLHFVFKANSDDVAKIGDKVAIRYQCIMDKELIIDKSFDETFDFTLGSTDVCPGMNNTIKGMKVGTKRRVKCSPADGYGENGLPPLIPPNAELTFEITLEAVNKTV